MNVNGITDITVNAPDEQGRNTVSITYLLEEIELEELEPELAE